MIFFLYLLKTMNIYLLWPRHKFTMSWLFLLTSTLLILLSQTRKSLIKFYFIVLVRLMHELLLMYSTFPTLAERKSATFGAKELYCRETTARIFSHLHALLTHLPLVSSFRHSFSSSASKVPLLNSNF